MGWTLVEQGWTLYLTSRGAMWTPLDPPKMVPGGPEIQWGLPAQVRIRPAAPCNVGSPNDAAMCNRFHVWRCYVPYRDLWIFAPSPFFALQRQILPNQLLITFWCIKRGRFFFTKKISNSTVRKRGKTPWNFEKSIMSNILRDERWQFFRKGVVDVST